MAKTPQVITDPYEELLRERKRHDETLAELEMWMRRSHVPTASGQVSTVICKLCEKPPAGKSAIEYRSTCPCKSSPAIIGNQRSRLRQAIQRGSVAE